MAKTKSFVLVMLIVAVWECILLWLVLHPGSATKVGNNTLFPFLLLPFFVVPLYSLYRVVQRWPRFKWGMVLLVLSVFLTVVFAFLHYRFQVDNLWVQRMFDLSQILFVVGNLLLVWQATRKHT
ncbi:MAG: hypothetical protein WA254_04010 [Candidatus Sulfotelmatobacter sp.]